MVVLPEPLVGAAIINAAFMPGKVRLVGVQQLEFALVFPDRFRGTAKKKFKQSHFLIVLLFPRTTFAELSLRPVVPRTRQYVRTAKV